MQKLVFVAALSVAQAGWASSLVLTSGDDSTLAS